MFLEIHGASNSDRMGDVIFVHGLDGDATATWTSNGGPGLFWPAWLGEDLPEIGVWSLNYDAASIAWKGSAMPLVDRATNVLASMEEYEFGRRPLVFITHSLGGLLVKQLLRHANDYEQPRWKEIAEQTRGIVFLATPHSGSDIASWLQYLSFVVRTNATINDLLAHDPSLRNLNLWFRAKLIKQNIRCQAYFETKKTNNIIVVNETSADPGIPGVVPIPLDANHREICKFGSKQEMPYKRIRSFVRSCLDLENGPSLLRVRIRRQGDQGDNENGIDGADVTLKLREPQSGISEMGGNVIFWIDGKDIGTRCQHTVRCAGFRVPPPRTIVLERRILERSDDFGFSNRKEITISLAPIADGPLSSPLITKPYWLGSTINMLARAKPDGAEYRVRAHRLGPNGFHLSFGVSNPNRLDMSIEEFELELLEYMEIEVPELSMFIGAAMPIRKFRCDLSLRPGRYACKSLSGEFDYIRLSQNELERFDIEVRAPAEGIYRIRPIVRFAVGEQMESIPLDDRIQMIGFFDQSREIGGWPLRLERAPPE